MIIVCDQVELRNIKDSVEGLPLQTLLVCNIVLLVMCSDNHSTHDNNSIHV